MSQVTGDYIDYLLPGYRFCPTDLELIVNYLQPKLESRELVNSRIHEVYLYDYTPEELAGTHRSCDNEWYFLTSRERMCPKGNRPKRITKNYGFWRTTQAKSEVYDERGRLVGYKRSLKFHEENKDKTEWLMHEYTTNDPNLPFETDGNKLNDRVLCKIYKKETSQNAKGNHVQAHDKLSRKRKRPSVNNQEINQPNSIEPQHVQVLEATHYHSGTHVQMAQPMQPVIISNQQLANNIDTSGGLNQTSYVNHHNIIHPMDTFCASNFMQPTIQDPDQVFPLEVAQSPLWNSTYGYQQNLSTCASSSTSPIESPTIVDASLQTLRSSFPVTSRDLHWDAVDSTPQLQYDDILTREEFEKYLDPKSFVDENNCPVWE